MNNTLSPSGASFRDYSIASFDTLHSLYYDGYDHRIADVFPTALQQENPERILQQHHSPYEYCVAS